MAYEMVMPYHLHMPSYFLETFTEYPCLSKSYKQYFFIVFSKMNGYIFISLLFLCGCVYFTIVPTKVCAPALFKIYTV